MYVSLISTILFTYRKEKELLKATETLEEKRLRRLNKKQVKDRKRKEDMGWDKEMMVRQSIKFPVILCRVLFYK